VKGPAEKWAQKVLAICFVCALVAIGLGFVLQAAHTSGGAPVLKLGFWILLATPTLRVATLLLAFLREKEKKFAWASAGVLFVLLASFFIAKQ
jgi:uncharacterized membrane protein